MLIGPLQTGHAYRCFCTPDQLAEKKAYLHKRGSTATYDRACTKLTEEEVGRRVRAKEGHVIRIDVGFYPTCAAYVSVLITLPTPTGLQSP